MTPDEIRTRLDRHEGRIAALEKSQDEMVISVDEIKKDTGEIVGILRDMQIGRASCRERVSSPV